MLLSIIIPAYNCANTLACAVESIAAYGWESAEILLIDDGSSDGTPAVISLLQNKYACIRSVRTENTGPSGARNTGMELASGDYLLFLDSDDAFTPEAFSVIRKALQTQPDMLIFGFRQCFFGKAKDRIYTAEEPFAIDAFYRKNLLNSVWNKAYKRDFILKNHIRFRPYRYGEDRLFNADVLRLFPEIRVIPDILYHYRMDNAVSLISGYIPEKFEACKEIYRQFSALCPDESVVDVMFIKNILSCMTVLFAENCLFTKTEKKAEIGKMLADPAVTSGLQNPQQRKDLEIIRKIIKSGNTPLNYRFAQTVSFCQKKLLPLFLKFRG